MLGENLKTLRKEKGFTQEALAAKLNVVRQTLSKWEKGLSVPDAEMLKQIAEILEVDVSQLLGADIIKEENKNEVAEQLARINEQLVIKNNRFRKIWKTIGIVLATLAVLFTLIVVVGNILFGVNTDSGFSTEEEITVEYDDAK